MDGFRGRRLARAATALGGPGARLTGACDGVCARDDRVGTRGTRRNHRSLATGRRNAAAGADGRARAGDAAAPPAHHRCRRPLRDGHVHVAAAKRAVRSRRGAEEQR